MKKLILFSVLCMIVNLAYSQISIIQNTEKKEKNYVTPYDSLYNIQPLSKKEGFFKNLIGQTLIYVNADCPNGKDYNLRYLDALGNEDIQTVDAPTIGAEFLVIDVLAKDASIYLDADLVLMDSATGKLYKYNPCLEMNSVWVVKGFYEKAKQLYKGKQFYYIEGATFMDGHDEILDLETGKKYGMANDRSKWTCTDVSIKVRDKDDYSMVMDYRSPVVLIIENELSHKCYCYLQNRNGDPLKNEYNSNETEGTNLFLGKFLDYEQYQKYNINLAERRKLLSKKYGTGNAELILKGKVKIGMTKEMCEESWGKPIKINETIGSFGIHEQWVYPNQYLYFENGYLTVIQD